MADILLCTLNAKYAHTAFGLRYLLANLGPLQQRACLLEFNINQRPLDMVEAILKENPRIVGLGIYIWNVAQTTELVGLLKALRPDITVVLGGPEVSYETTEQAIVAMSDHVVTGEGEVTFRWLCEQLLGDVPVPHKILVGQTPDIASLVLPYDLYSDRGYRAAGALCRGIARLPLPLRVLLVVARYLGAAIRLGLVLTSTQAFAGKGGQAGSSSSIAPSICSPLQAPEFCSSFWTMRAKTSSCTSKWCPTACPMPYAV